MKTIPNPPKPDLPTNQRYYIVDVLEMYENGMAAKLDFQNAREVDPDEWGLGPLEVRDEKCLVWLTPEEVAAARRNSDHLT